MFENVVAEQHLGEAILERNLLHVEVELRQRALEIGRHVALGVLRVEAAEVAHQADLGGDVQQPRAVVEQPRLAHEPEPEQAVAFEREAVGAERIGARGDVAVGEELAVVGTAYGALDPAAAVEESRKGHHPAGKPLQQCARQVVEDPFDDSAHRRDVFLLLLVIPGSGFGPDFGFGRPTVGCFGRAVPLLPGGGRLSFPGGHVPQRVGGQRCRASAGRRVRRVIPESCGLRFRPCRAAPCSGQSARWPA